MRDWQKPILISLTRIVRYLIKLLWIEDLFPNDAALAWRVCDGDSKYFYLIFGADSVRVDSLVDSVSARHNPNDAADFGILRPRWISRGT